MHDSPLFNLFRVIGGVLFFGAILGMIARSYPAAQGYVLALFGLTSAIAWGASAALSMDAQAKKGEVRVRLVYKSHILNFTAALLTAVLALLQPFITVAQLAH